VFGLEKLGMKFGLENIRAICSHRGNPQDAFPSVIVAGTNGKGSVAAFTDAALRAARIRTGLYTSPHLVRLEERFAIDGTPIPTSRLANALTRVRESIERLMEAGTLVSHPTFFEATTAAAFELFRSSAVQMAVLEVGLGGRLDSTNVASPIAAAITTIDLDHERILGASLAAIAFEKAGVVKPGMMVVVGEEKPEALDVIERVCRERDAMLTRAMDGVEAHVRMEKGHAVLGLTTPKRSYAELRVGLAGRHQAANAIVAARLLEQLETLGIPVGREAVEAGIAGVSWPGRLDLRRVSSGRHLLLDAAHNPAGAKVLAEYLREAHPSGLPILFAAMEDKNAGEMLDALLPCATSLIVTRPANPRAQEPRDLAAEARSIRPALAILIEPDPSAALEKAWEICETVLATGSIFLVGELMGMLEAGALGPRPLGDVARTG
jgi:dihydrofolate synthase / folylpolyglutamate synthase